MSTLALSLSLLALAALACSDGDDGAGTAALSIAPAVGACSQESRLSGQGFNPSRPIEVAGVFDLLETTAIANVQPDGDGAFEIVLPAGTIPADGCHPGREYLIRASQPDAEREAAAVYTIDSDWVIDLSSDPCDADATVRGTGFPPNASIAVSWGSAHQFVEYDFARLVTARSDASGSFVERVDLSTPCGASGEVAIYAWPAEEPPTAVGWAKAPLP